MTRMPFSSAAICILLIYFSSILILFLTIIEDTSRRNGIDTMWLLQLSLAGFKFNKTENKVLILLVKTCSSFRED